MFGSNFVYNFINVWIEISIDYFNINETVKRTVLDNNVTPTDF